MEVASAIQSYRIGDWLINYQDGLVRRGFIGQLVYLMSSGGLSPIWLVYAIQSLMYFLLSYYVLRLYCAQPRSKTWLLILFSPAFIFLFPFYDPSGWYRKEIIVYLALVLLLYGLREGQIRRYYLWISLLVYFVAVFSHEVASLTLIFFLYPLYTVSQQGVRHKSPLFFFMAAFSAVAMFGFILSVALPGGVSAVEKICSSLTLRGVDSEICGGAIQYLSLDMHHGLREVWNKIQTRQYLLIYSLLAFLSAIPILLSNWWQKKIVFLALGCLSITPLFFIGMDWGRWVAIVAALIYLTLLFDSTREPILMRPVSWAAVMIYGALWSIPHIQGAPTRLIETYAGSGPGLGLIDLGFSKLPREITQSPLRNPIWMDLQKHYKGLIIYPLQEYSAEQDIFYYFGKMNFITSNIKSIGDLSKTGIQEENRNNLVALAAGQYLPKNFYILDQTSALVAWRNINSEKDLLAKINGFYVLAPQWKIISKNWIAINHSGMSEFGAFYKLDQKIDFSNNYQNDAPFLFDGWSTPESWGTWSMGSSAMMQLPLPKAAATKLDLKIRAFLGKERAHQKVDIFINEVLIKKVTFSNDEDQLIELDIPKVTADQNLLTLRFEIEHPVSPYELGISEDRRKLGIGVRWAQFR